MKLHNTWKRLLAGVISCLMMVSALPATAFAASEKATMTFAYSYQSDGTEIVYHDTFTVNGITSGGTDGSHHRTTIYANGEEAYCIQPGVSLHRGDVLTANASDTWDALSSEVQEAMKLALALGRPGNSANLSGSAGSQYVATQMVVWEFVSGFRDPVTYQLYDNSIYRSLCKDGYNAEVAQVYDEIMAAIHNYKVMPSFANGNNYEMSYENGRYTLTLTDTNGMLSDCAVTSSDSSVSVSKSGQQLIISSGSYIDGSVTITLTKSSHISASSRLVAYGDASLQDVLVGVAKTGDVTASFTVSTPGGGLKIVKTSEDGKVSGIRMTVTGDGYSKTAATGEDGTLTLSGLVPGTYTVTEAVSDYYEPQEVKTVTIKSGETATVSFNNTLKRGDLSVVKTAEDGLAEGVTFHLYGISASGQTVDLYAVTDATGTAIFEDVLTSGVSGYTLEEMDTALRYVVPDAQSQKIFWNEVTNTTVTNVLKKFNVTVCKLDAETGKAQGDATLAGAVYGLYHDGELVDTYTTNEQGSFTTEYYVCDNTWTIQEITPSEGYLLDETVYHVGAEPENYTVELNTALPLNSYEQVIKGRIAIIKHSDTGDTQIETPEEGASFEVYPASAGSYEQAEESERDVLVCDEDGFAQSKELPYGLYTVHQIAGNEDAEFMRDFTVYICENGQVYKYLMNNAPYSAYLKVVKADSETGKTIPLTGAGFQIYDAAGELVTMHYTYPIITVIDTFYVSDDGYLVTPQTLPVGDYALVEVQAPYGYVLDSTPIPFTVSRDAGGEESGLTVIAVTAYDAAQKGRITVSKSGEVFVSVQMSGDEEIIDKEGSIALVNCVYTPVYAGQALAGATYQIIAAEDIVTGDGTLRYAAGTVVDEITTGEDGTATSKELYLGRYQVVEAAAPEGMVLNAQPVEAVLTYAGQEVSVTEIAAGFVNDRQKVSITAEKVMEQDEAFGIGDNGEILAVSFGLFAGEDITAQDGSVIPKDGMIEIAFCDAEGLVVFQSDLPFGSYYVKELSTDAHYTLSDTVYEFDFSYAGQDTALQTVALNDGAAIENRLKRGRVEGYKVDGTETGLAGAVFGLFHEDAQELTAENAYLTVVSGEDGYFAFENVPYGDYFVYELTAPEGFVASDARHYVSVSYDTQVIGLKVIDYPIIGGVQLTKVDEDYPDNHLTGAVFALYADADGDGVFDPDVDESLCNLSELADGVYQMDGLRYGSYFLQETQAPEGFLPDENVYAFSITEDKQLVVIENEAGVGFMNQPIKGTVTIYKTDTDTGEKLVGAGFRVLDKDGTVIAEGYTGEDGTVSFELRYGEYTVYEYEAPEGYVLDDTPYAFAVTEDGQELSIDMANLKIRGTFGIAKVEAGTEKPLSGAGFRIYDAAGNLVYEGYTDENGMIAVELDFGQYTYQEFAAPEGYLLEDTLYSFSITEDGQMLTMEVTNEKIPEETPEDTTPETPEETTTPNTPKQDTPTTTTTDAPKTGDDANIGLWAALAGIAALAGCGLIGIVVHQARKKEDQDA